MVAGRGFSKKFPADENDAVLINETFAEQLNIPFENIIGKKIKHLHWGEQKVVGIVKNFNFESLHSGIKPLVIKMIWPHRQTALTDYIAIRIESGKMKSAIQFIENQWKKLAPSIAFEYYFLSQKLDQFYKSESALSRLASIFTLIAVAIACLGLLGFVSFIAEWKTKEIAMRKVLGASVSNIIRLISKEFFILVLISNVLAWPIAYLAANKWLQNFAFRAEMSLWIFVLASVSIILVTLLTITFRTIKAAVQNPVKFLKYE